MDDKTVYIVYSILFGEILGNAGVFSTMDKAREFRDEKNKNSTCRYAIEEMTLDDESDSTDYYVVKDDHNV